MPYFFFSAALVPTSSDVLNVSNQCSTAWKYKYSVNYVGSTVGSVLVEHAAYRSRYIHSRIPIRCRKIQPVRPKNVDRTCCTVCFLWEVILSYWLNQAKSVKPFQLENVGFCTTFCGYKVTFCVLWRTRDAPQWVDDEPFFVFLNLVLDKVIFVVRFIANYESVRFRHPKFNSFIFFIDSQTAGRPLCSL